MYLLAVGAEFRHDGDGRGWVLDLGTWWVIDLDIGIRRLRRIGDRIAACMWKGIRLLDARMARRA